MKMKVPVVTAKTKWFTGKFDRSCSANYIHLIRSPDDPERLSREERHRRIGLRHGRDVTATAWKKLDDCSIAKWKERILAGLRDGKPRTWNRLILEITNFHYTADVVFGKRPDKALWALVEEGKVELTAEAPVLFRLKGAKRW